MKDHNKIIMEIYRRMYKEAEPCADIHQIIKSGEGKKEGFFRKYYLSEKRQNEIINEVCKKHKVRTKWEINQYTTAVCLGSSPTSNREVMIKERGNK